MSLYEVIFWGSDGSEDTIYLVRATDWCAAVEHVRDNASPTNHGIHHTTLAHHVHEIGRDLCTLGEPQEQILRGPYFQHAYNHGWRAWNREIVGTEYSSEWIEETHATYSGAKVKNSG